MSASTTQLPMYFIILCAREKNTDICIYIVYVGTYMRLCTAMEKGMMRVNKWLRECRMKDRWMSGRYGQALGECGLILEELYRARTLIGVRI